MRNGIGIARHPGAGSGCQGCDPEVKMPAITDRAHVCADCYRWFEQHYGSEAPNLLHLAERRRVVAKTRGVDMGV